MIAGLSLHLASWELIKPTVIDERFIEKKCCPFNVGGRSRALALDVTEENVILTGGVLSHEQRRRAPVGCRRELTP